MTGRTEGSLSTYRKFFQFFCLIFSLLLISCTKDDADIIEKEVPKVPDVRTNEVSNINVYSVTMGCEVIDEGDAEITEVGLVLGTKSKPTLEINFTKFNLTKNEYGNYSVRVTSLPEEATTYYIRAFAVNKYGVGYGNEIQFSTLGNKTYHGSISLTSQEEVNNFGARGHNTITGDFNISGSVTDLSPLKDLHVINSAFNVENTTSLVNFKGLENLRRTGVVFPNGFYVKNNHALTSFSGLESLYITRGEFYVINNNKLRNLEGLHSFFAASAGNLIIENCPNLIELKGLEKLEFVGGFLAVRNNNSLGSISSLSKLNTVSAVILNFNESLPNLNGLEGLKNIDYLELSLNPLLSNLDGIKNCESLNSIKIEGNKNLFHLPKFTQLKLIDNMTISYGSEIKNLSGLENLDEIRTLKFFRTNIQSLEGVAEMNKIETLEINECENLHNLMGLENVQAIDNLIVTSSSKFNSLEGFKLKTMNNLVLGGTDLTSLMGLESLTIIHEGLNLGGNYKLESTSGLTNLQALGSLSLENNPKLTNIDAFKNLKSLNLLSVSYENFDDLEGFGKLETIKEMIIQETKLKSLSGLESLQQIKSLFVAKHNPNLMDYCSISSAFQSFTGTYEVYSNAYNPTIEEMKNGICN